MIAHVRSYKYKMHVRLDLNYTAILVNLRLMMTIDIHV